MMTSIGIGFSIGTLTSWVSNVVSELRIYLGFGCTE